MASWNQTFSGNSNYYLTLTVTETGIDTSTNTSTLSYSLTATKTAGSGYWTSNKYTASVSINGTQVASVSASYDFTYSTPQTITLASGSGIIVKHEDSGAKTITVSGSYTTSSSIGSASISQSMVLTNIPRASTFTMNAYSLNPSSGSLVMTLQKASSSFWHQTIVTVNGTQKESWNAQQYNNVTWSNSEYKAFCSTSGVTTMTFTLVTYSDSGHTNEVGRYSANVMYSALTSVPLRLYKSGNTTAVALGGATLYGGRVTFGLPFYNEFGIHEVSACFSIQGSTTAQVINLDNYSGSGYLLFFRGNYWGNYYKMWYVSTRTSSSSLYLIGSGGSNHATVELDGHNLSISCDSYGGTYFLIRVD